MSETLLEAARRELPGINWCTHGPASYPGITGVVGQLEVDVWPTGRLGLAVRVVGNGAHYNDRLSQADAFNWLRDQLAAQRDACDRALGGGWRKAADGLPEVKP